ncbi:hypothetical protein RBB50_008901 [Rhinocladiella similis]
MNEFYNLAEKGEVWLSKSFKTQPDGHGKGTNRVRLSNGQIRHENRYITYPGTFIIDGKPVVILDYSHFDNVPSRDYQRKGEVRVLGKYNYLCVVRSEMIVKGMTPRPRANGQGGAEPEFYPLRGLVAPWREFDDPRTESKESNGY